MHAARPSQMPYTAIITKINNFMNKMKNPLELRLVNQVGMLCGTFVGLRSTDLRDAVLEGAREGSAQKVSRWLSKWNDPSVTLTRQSDR